MELIILALMLLISDIWGVNRQLYTEFSLFVSASINKETVKMFVEKNITDMIVKEASKILKYVKNLNIFIIQFKLCQILIIGIIKVRSMQNIRSIKLIV